MDVSHYLEYPGIKGLRKQMVRYGKIRDKHQRDYEEHMRLYELRDSNQGNYARMAYGDKNKVRDAEERIQRTKDRIYVEILRELVKDGVVKFVLEF